MQMHYPRLYADANPAFQTEDRAIFPRCYMRNKARYDQFIQYIIK